MPHDPYLVGDDVLMVVAPMNILEWGEGGFPPSNQEPAVMTMSIFADCLYQRQGEEKETYLLMEKYPVHLSGCCKAVGNFSDSA
ncbi:hypothetical protein NPIL_174601 [Nephila pilipes]|uniref:Uncharacterized protein n=1 Tax=Nephila pilipes TaxID=299642 RepID=A0A8X6UP72_NEPPI|nr:hypothetical protein NPIL_174601 [Nephila pilipes]